MVVGNNSSIVCVVLAFVYDKSVVQRQTELLIVLICWSPRGLQ